MTQHVHIDWDWPQRPAVNFDNSSDEMRLADLDLGSGTRRSLRLVAAEVSAEEGRQFRRLLPGASAKARFVARHWDFAGPARAIDELLSDPSAFGAAAHPVERTRLRRAAVARLALEYFAVKSRLPDSILALYPDLFAQMARFLCEKAIDGYDDDYFFKDARYALGLTVPAGAAQVDLQSRIGPKIICRELARTWSPSVALRYGAASAWGQWYNLHLDLRRAKEFTPAGWTACYARIAEMLKLNPRMRGVAGVSWFYDPALRAISPHLAYLRETPVRNGAFLVRIGTLPHDIENATVRSPLRKRLYEEGRYQPTCFVLAWPRRELLAWASNDKGERLPLPAQHRQRSAVSEQVSSFSLR